MLSAATVTPAVSVILPVFNGAATLARALDSIRVQTFGDWDLIVIDDGSTDNSAEIVVAAGRLDRRVRSISRPHEGIAAALNAGIAAARGEFIARMDADDASDPARLEQQVSFLRASENRNIGVVGCGVVFGGDRSTSAGYALHVDWINSLNLPEEIALNRFVEAPFAHPSVMFRTALVERFGGYREGDFPEDYELWLRWLAAGVSMAKVPRTLLRWNDPPTRLSRMDARYSPDAFFRLKAGFIARWLAANDIPRTRKIFVWGAGRHTRKRAGHLANHGIAIAGYIDVDAKKATPALGGSGVPVLLPDALPGPGTIFVLCYVTTRGAREWNERELRARGYIAGRDFLMCA